MLGLLSTVALLAYLAFGRPDASKDENIRTGLVGCAVAFLLYCVLQLRCVAFYTVGGCWRLPRSLNHPTVDCHTHGTPPSSSMPPSQGTSKGRLPRAQWPTTS
jgi:hypothetical protein